MSDSPESSETAGEQAVVCARCGEKHAPAAMMQERRIRDDLLEMVLVCPGCGHQVHCYVDSPALRGQRQAVQEALARYRAKRTRGAWHTYQTARQAYNRQFDRHNLRWRRKLGMYEGGHGERSSRGE